MPDDFHERLSMVLEADTRFRPEAYQFLFSGLDHTAKRLKLDTRSEREERHVSGPQLCEGLRDLALRRYGYLARAVFEQWGVTSTDDWGAIVFNLINAELMSKTDADSPDDFHAVYEFADALEEAYFRDRWHARDTADNDADDEPPPPTDAPSL